MFRGEDPIGWIARAEKFFEIHNTEEEAKTQLAFISMEGLAVHWFKFLKKKNPDLSWEKLMTALIQRYRGRMVGSHYEQLTILRKMGQWMSTSKSLKSWWHKWQNY